MRMGTDKQIITKLVVALAGCLMASTASAGRVSSSAETTLSSITFNVPLKVMNINPAVKNLVVMCQVFSALGRRSDDLIGRTVKSIAVGKDRKVAKKVVLKLTSKEVSPRSSLSKAAKFLCSFAVQVKPGSRLLTYSIKSKNTISRAVRKKPITSSRGVLDKRNVNSRGGIIVHTGKLSAIGIAKEQTAPRPTNISSVEIKVPLNITNIHPDIRYVVTQCRISKNALQNTANMLDRFRVETPVKANRKVVRTVTVKLTGFNSQGADMNDVTHYACLFYIRAATGPLLAYSTTSSNEMSKSAARPTTGTAGAVDRSRVDSAGRIRITSGVLSAKGAYGL